MGVVHVKKLCAAGCDVQVRQGVPRPDPFTTSAPHSVSGAEVLLGFTWADSPRESPHVTETPSPDIHIPCALRHTGLQARAAPNGHTEHRSVAPCRRGHAVHPGHTPPSARAPAPHPGSSRPRALPCSGPCPAPQGVCRVSSMVDGCAHVLPGAGLPAGLPQHLCPCVLPAEAGLWRGTHVPHGELAPVLTGKARGSAVASVPGSGPCLGYLLGMGCCRWSWLKLHVRGS